MRVHRVATCVIVLGAFGLGCPAEPPPRTPATRASAPTTNASPPAPAAPVVATDDTPHITASGHTFVVPARWSVRDVPERRATVLGTPDGDRGLVAVVEVNATSPDEAALAAARAVGIDRPIDGPGRRQLDRRGFTQLVQFVLVVRADEPRTITAVTHAVGGVWVVVVTDLDNAAYTRLLAERGRILGTLAAKGYVRPTLAGKHPRTLDAPRLAALDRFIEDARARLGVPGVAVGILQDDKVVVRKGYGVRAVGSRAPVTPSTRFLLFSATKPLTTLMISMLADEGKLAWNTPVTTLSPGFTFGDATRTARLELAHLACACSGSPRRDLEWTYRGSRLTADDVVALLRETTPTSELGTRFEYSNLAMAAAGFLGARTAYPTLELGAAYDRAMSSRVFSPLGMRDTTMDPIRARTGNFAVGHQHDPDGGLRPVSARINDTVAAVRPAGGAWSTVDDLLVYLQLELGEGKLGPEQLVSRASLLARRDEQLRLTSGGYGLGLFVDRSQGITIYSHHGDGHGYMVNLLWIPEARIGVVILTNATAGSSLRTAFTRKLLELVFDAEPGAEQVVELAAETAADERRYYRPMLEHPPSAAIRARLARRYRHRSLGDLTITMRGGLLWLETDAWQDELAVYRERDYLELITWSIAGRQFEIRDGPPRALVLSDGSRQYVFEEVRN